MHSPAFAVSLSDLHVHPADALQRPTLRMHNKSNYSLVLNLATNILNNRLL